jgi:asparagine synthase (glutamine-hydrolysing)
MCGIAGFFGAGDQTILKRMTDRIRHRGPDADGFLIEPDNGVHLGHRRLSILDISGGVQPMHTQDGALSIVFNGEIYNFAELRAELTSAGYEFQTDHSDTEVLLHGYRHWGHALTSRLNGMWAFALYDRSRREVFFSRDRFGKKPFFYFSSGDCFVFSSELHSLQEHPSVPREIDPRALRKYYAYGFVPAPLTFFQGVRKLPAGHSLVLELDGLRIRQNRYWNYQPEPVEAIPLNAEKLWSEELISLLDAAVKRRLVADVPVGAFLSGGIDSSLISALAMRHVPRDKIRMFSIGFEEAGFDETAFAKQVSAHIGAQHSIETLSIQRALDIIPDILDRLDEPFADSSLLPTYLLCRHARREVTVALGGDGADELFAGYDPFRALRYASWYARVVPKPVHKAIRLVASRMPVSHGYMSLDFRIKRTLRGLDHPAKLHLPVWMSPLAPDQLEDLFGESIDLEDVYSEAIEAWEECDSRDPVDRTIAFFIRLYLQEDILAKVDRASMLNSLEVRAPFLDIDLVDFIRRLPTSFKLRNGTTKWLLKKSAESLLPCDIIHRKKQGFAVPIGQWFADGKLDVDPALQAINPDFWRRIMQEHKAHKVDHRIALWSNFIVNRTLSYQTAPNTPPQ